VKAGSYNEAQGFELKDDPSLKKKKKESERLQK
jgi:hypothetical protein